MNKKLFYGKTAQSVFERLKFVLGVNTAKEVGQIAGLAESSISSAIARNSIPFNFCAEVALTHGIPLDWLIFGDVDGDKAYRAIELDFFKRAYSQAHILGTEKAKEPVIFNEKDIDFINLYSMTTISENGKFFSNKHVIRKIPYEKNWLSEQNLNIKELLCLKNKGDNMQPDIYDGDVVLVNRAVKYGDGIYAIRLNDTLRIKRLQWLTDGTIRVSSNKSYYEPETIDPSKSDGRFEIIGQCHSRNGLLSQ